MTDITQKDLMRKKEKMSNVRIIKEVQRYMDEEVIDGETYKPQDWKYINYLQLFPFAARVYIFHSPTLDPSGCAIAYDISHLVVISDAILKNPILLFKTIAHESMHIIYKTLSMVYKINIDKNCEELYAHMIGELAGNIYGVLPAHLKTGKKK